MENLLHPNQLPSVDRIMQSDCFISLCERYGRDTVLTEVREKLDHTRTRLIKESNSKDRQNKPDSSTGDSKTLAIEYLHGEVKQSLLQHFIPSIRRVINLTGTILHTNLGRAPYPPSAIEAMIEVSRGACNLEYNLEDGVRGRRDDHVEEWICKLTGAEAATTVNNNAAAVLLTLNSIAFKKNVIVSRGELIEIGGSFRVPAIMNKAGCKLREVGTTNRTHLHDYEGAIGKKTAALMKVHTSNYEINGFTKDIAASELAELARKKNVILIDDLGSGTLTDLSKLGLPYERTARDALQDGADIITFSGDKLLGGPQCGIIAGRRDLIKLIDKNPMKRAMRLDKVTLAALEAVLKLYAKTDQLTDSIPSLDMLSRNPDDIKKTAFALQDILQKSMPEMKVSISPCESQIGSGALPTRTLDSYAVVIEGNVKVTAASLADKFRQLPVPVIGRISQNSLWLDCRALRDELEELTSLMASDIT